MLEVEQNKFLINEDQKNLLVNRTKTAFEMAKIITRRAQPLYLFGGIVRNLLLGKETIFSDYDFIGNFNLDQIQSDYSELVIGRWDEVYTIKLKIGPAVYDFVAASNIEAKLSECDITVSTICLTNDGVLIDYFNGLESLSRKEIKIIDPDIKITKDPSRILRIFRFAAELGFNIEEETFRSAVMNAFLLENASYTDIMWEILSLDYDTRTKILKTLYLYDIDRHISFPKDISIQGGRVLRLEEEINRRAPVDEIVNLFHAQIYLVGGAVRDMILEKKVKDFDFKIQLPFSEMIHILEQNGFIRTKNLNLSSGEYYINERTKSISIFVNGVDIDFSEITTTNIEILINEGDVNFSCCIFNVNTRKIENPELIQVVMDKELRFCNSKNAAEDPIIVINALKQISRIPEIIIDRETEEIILKSIPMIVELIHNNPDLKYKIAALCGNLNSEMAFSFFEKVEGAMDIFEGISRKKSKLLVSNEKYISQTVEELSADDKLEIINLLKSAFKERYNESKEFPVKINSVVFEKRNGEIVACCLVDGERIYTAAAKNGYDWIAIFADLAKNNYNIWCTVDYNNPKVQALCTVGGLRPETNPKIIENILKAKCGKNKEDIEIYKQDDVLVFVKKDKESYPQILLRS